MRNWHLIGLIALVLALALVVSAGAAIRPTLRIVADTPLTLRGAHFQPREAVRVNVTMGELRLARQTRAGSLGGFTVRFAGVRIAYCSPPLVVTARGAVSGLVRAWIPVRDCAMP
jgi:hypothetical protein